MVEKIERECKMKEQKKYEISVTERTEDIHEGSGVLKKIKRKIHLHREAVIAESKAAARSKVERKLTKKMTDENAEDFIDRLEVEVVECTFRG